MAILLQEGKPGLEQFSVRTDGIAHDHHSQKEQSEAEQGKAAVSKEQPGRGYPFISMSFSAIWMALRAAPFQRLSPATNNERPLSKP